MIVNSTSIGSGLGTPGKLHQSNLNESVTTSATLWLSTMPSSPHTLISWPSQPFSACFSISSCLRTPQSTHFCSPFGQSCLWSGGACMNASCLYVSAHVVLSKLKSDVFNINKGCHGGHANFVSSRVYPLSSFSPAFSAPSSLASLFSRHS